MFAGDLMHKLEDGRAFDWDDLNKLVRRTVVVDRHRIIADCISGYRFLLALTEEERVLAADAHQHQRALLQKLKADMER